MFSVIAGFVLILGAFALARYEFARWRRNRSSEVAQRLADLVIFGVPLILEAVVFVGLITGRAVLVYRGLAAW